MKELRFTKGVNREKEWGKLIDIYVNTSMADSGEGVFDTIKSLMFFAACLGYSKGKRKELKPPLEDIQSSIFENDDNTVIVYLIALAETKDINIFKSVNEKEMIKIFEEYANGGFSIMSEWEAGQVALEPVDKIFNELINLDIFEIVDNRSNNSSNISDVEF